MEQPLTPEESRAKLVVEVCDRLGITLKPNLAMDKIRYHPKSVMDQHPELLVSATIYKVDVLKYLKDHVIGYL